MQTSASKTVFGRSLIKRVAAAARAALLLLFAASAGAQESKVLPGHVPAPVPHLTPLGRLPASQRLNLALGLPLRNQNALTDFLRQLYDPASPEYHHYLTPAQFSEEFGPSAEDYQAVLAFAQTNGFTVTSTHPNRMLVDVNAQVADIEKAFHLAMRVYQHPVEARTFYAPDADPTVAAALPILDVSGLTDFGLPHSLAHVTPPTQPSIGARPASGSGPGGAYLGNDFRAAYLPGVAATGLGQVVGLAEFDGYYSNDIVTYEQKAGLTNVPLTNVLLDSFNGTPGSDNLEVALDIEVAVAMAPGLNQIIVYEAGINGIQNDVFNRMATDDLARQLSSSWTASSGANATTDQIFQEFAAQGQSFFQASGDSGAYTGSINQVAEPADNPYITVVGGTTLTTDGPGGNWLSETTWNQGAKSSGGGISTSYSIPAWQQGISMAANQGSTTMRNIPDVALTAQNVWIAYNNGGSGAAYGTSCAAPLWAAFTALLNQQALANGKLPLGFLNPAIYPLGKGTNHAAMFRDITTGNNTNSASPGRFSAAAGYDLCTGWGTPVGLGLMSALAGPPAPAIVSNSLAIVLESCPDGAVDPGETVTLSFGLVNVGTANTTNLIATLQSSGGVISPSSEQIYGALKPGAAVAQPFTFTAGGSCGGNLTATLQLQDGAANLGNVNFKIQLGIYTTRTTSENFDGVTAPALPPGWATAVVSGIASNWVTTNGVSDTAPNSAFARDATTAGLNELVSPLIPIASPSAQLTFRQNYNFAWNTTGHPHPTTTYYDGGVLEIAIGNGGFTNILSAGGSFVTGAYNCVLSSANGNALGGRNAWGGSSGGWVPVTVNLPAAAAGQNIRLRWGCGTGINKGFTAVGWFVDTISIQDTYYACCTQSINPPAIATQPSNAVATADANVTFNVTATGTAPLNYRWFFNATNLISVDTNSLALTNVQPGQTGSYVVVITNVAGSITSAPATLTVNLLASSVALASSENPSGFKDNVDFTATVTPANAAGTIQFLTNGVAFDAETLAASQAVSTNLASLLRGTNVITAVYSGDGNDFPSTNALVQIVTNHPPMAAAVYYSRVAGYPLDIAVTNLAAYWSDLDGDVVSLAAVGVSTNGMTLTNSAGTLVYFNPNNVDDKFVCTISDGWGGTNFQAVYISTRLLAIASVAVNPDGTVTLAFTGPPGSICTLEETANLSPANWQPVATNSLGTNGVWQFTDAQAASFRQLFYRIKLAP